MTPPTNRKEDGYNMDINQLTLTPHSSRPSCPKDGRVHIDSKCRSPPALLIIEIPTSYIDSVWSNDWLSWANFHRQSWITCMRDIDYTKLPIHLVFPSFGVVFPQEFHQNTPSICPKILQPPRSSCQCGGFHSTRTSAPCLSFRF